MKNFQQNKVAMKIALSLMLGSALFLSACGEEGEDKEVRGTDYYLKDLAKAKSKLQWCAKKMDYPFEKIEKSIETKTIASHSEITKVIDKAYSEKKLDGTNHANCLNAYLVSAY